MINLQHDCPGSGCSSLGAVRRQQERTLSRSIKFVIEHNPTGRFIVNTNSLHNYNHIHDVIPPHLRGNSIRFSESEADSLRKEAARVIRGEMSDTEQDQNSSVPQRQANTGQRAGSTSEPGRTTDTTNPAPSVNVRPSVPKSSVITAAFTKKKKVKKEVTPSRAKKTRGQRATRLGSGEN